MSGHSKWANIKHKKGKADAERGKVFNENRSRNRDRCPRRRRDPTVNGKPSRCNRKSESQQYAERKHQALHRESGG